MTMQQTQGRGPLDAVLTAAGRVILGKQEALRLSLSCLLAGGHLLIEDLPGVGKTTLAHTLAALLGLDFRRLQFTADLLPADILGAAVYEPARGEFRFHPGPVFAQVLLADEVNRATPRAQSALLEAMEEGQVSVDGVSHPLPEPFFVIATQNPREQVGTFPLPESQLDRFLMRLSLGYPDASAERALLKGEDRRELLARMNPLVDPAALRGWSAATREVHVADVVLDYLLTVLDASRHHPAIDHGLSPRAGLAWLHAAQAWAWLEGRSALRPDDLQRLAVPVLAHRLAPAREAGSVGGAELVRRLLEGVAVP
jgi:MoxR-like ATPase